MAGRVLSALEGGGAVAIVAMLAVLIAAIVVTGHLVVRHAERVREVARRQLRRRRVASISGAHRRRIELLARRYRPGAALGIWLSLSVVVTIAVGWAFGTVVHDVLGDRQVAAIDRPVQTFFVRRRATWLTPVMTIASVMAVSSFLLAMISVVGGALSWVRRSFRPVALLGLAFLGSNAISNVVKLLVERPRPLLEGDAHHFYGSSFPSGHSTYVVAVYGMLAALLAVRRESWAAKVAMWAGVAVLSVLVGVSRMYLGAHWVSDVLAGWALGGAWLVVLLAAVRTVDEIHKIEQIIEEGTDSPEAEAAPPAGLREHGRG